MKQIKHSAVINTFVFVCSFVGLAEATTYWASPNGSNSATCTAISGTNDPGRYGSFARSVACASASGDVVMTKPGTYTSDATILNPSSGITIRGSDATPGNWPVLRPSGEDIRAVNFNNTIRSNITFQYIRWDLSNTTNGVRCINSSSDSVVTNLTVKDAECLGPPVGKANGGGAGFLVGVKSSNWKFQRVKISRWHSSTTNPGTHCFYWSGSNGLIENVDCSDVNGWGVQFYTGYGTGVDNNILRYSTFHGFKLRGPVLVQSNATGNKIYGNVFYDYALDAIRLGGTNTTIWNNTIYNAKSGSRGIVVGCNSGCEVRNNIIYVPGGTAISGSGATTIANNLTVDPMFVDINNSNFRLQQASQAINKGSTLSTVAIDLDGNTRPQGGYYDIGAYEYVLSTTAASAPPASPSSLQATSR